MFKTKLTFLCLKLNAVRAFASALLIGLSTIGTMAAGSHLDFGFGSGGTTQFSFGSNTTETANAIVIQPDGKIIVAGRTNANGTWDFAVARLNADGSFDATFDGDGMQTIDFGGNVDTAWTVALQADGKILIAGESLPLTGIGDFAVARLNTNGALDATFDGDGKATIDFQNGNDVAFGLVIQADGKIVLAGRASGSDWGIVRLDTAGVPDVTFGANGRVSTDFAQLNDTAKGVALLPDGRIVVAGTAFAQGSQNFALARYSSTGGLDNSFNGNGKIVTDIGSFTNDEVNSFERMSDGRLVVAGTSANPENGRQAIAIARYNADGTPDNTFDSDGKVVTTFNPNGNNYIQNIAVDGTGQIAAAGRIDSQAPGSGFNVIRYSPNGSLLTNFGAGGIVNTLFGLSEREARDVAFLPDGKVIAVGAVRGYADFGVARYNTTGIAATGDFDGAGKADFGVFRSTDGIWYLKNSDAGAQTYVAFGGPGDLPVPGDYDGDGKVDPAIFRKSSSTWYILRSSDNSFGAIPFGVSGDTLVQADYDGDSRTDIAVFRPATGIWYIQRSSLGFAARQFGNQSDRPVPGDYDGDGLTDVAIFRPSDGTWWVDASVFGLSATQFGVSSDQAVPADYDGDNITDIAVFRSSTGDWYIVNSRSSSVQIVHWGLAGDRPSPADFDADGHSDLAVFRPSNGFWYVLQSRDASLRSLEWGRVGDLPVPQSYFSTTTGL